MKKIIYLLLLCVTTIAHAQLFPYISTVAGNTVGGFSGDGASALAAEIHNPNSVCVDKWGNIYFVDEYNNRVRKVDLAGTITTIAGKDSVWLAPHPNGDGGPATNAKLCYPTGIAVDTLGNVYIAEQQMQLIRKINTAGIITTFAGQLNLADWTGDGGPATAAKLWKPFALAFDKLGNLYVTEKFNFDVRKITPAGIISTVAGSQSSGSTGNGGPATAATFTDPRGITVDKNGNIYIADGTSNVVRKVDASGTIHAFAGTGTGGTFSGEGIPATDAVFYYPFGLASDDSGYVYIADILNNRVRMVAPNGLVHTLAGSMAGYSGDGGPATAAYLYNPEGVACDASGNVFVAEYLNNVIRKISPLYCTPNAGLVDAVSNQVCPCMPVQFIDETLGGTWSVVTGHASINSLGMATAVSAGPDTVVYTLIDSCGTARASMAITVLDTARCDTMKKILGKHLICLDSSMKVTDTITGGVWGKLGTRVSINDTGKVTADSAGADTLTYTLHDSCGTKIITYPVYVLTKAQCDSVNSVPTVNSIETAILYPNPATNQVTIKTGSNTYTELRLYNNMGTLVLKQFINNRELTLDIKNLPKGVYFIRLISEDQNEVKQFIKY